MKRAQLIGLFLDIILTVPVAFLDRVILRFGDVMRREEMDFGFPKIT